MILILTGTIGQCGKPEPIGFGGGGAGGDGGQGGETTNTTTSGGAGGETAAGGATGGAGGSAGSGGTGGAMPGDLGTLCAADEDCALGLTCEQANPDNQGAVTMCTRGCAVDLMGNPVSGSCGEPGLSCIGTFHGNYAICYAMCVTADDCRAGFDCVGPFVVGGDKVCMPLPQ